MSKLREDLRGEAALGRIFLVPIGGRMVKKDRHLHLFSLSSMITYHLLKGKHLGMLESVSTPELSSTLASHEEEEDRTTHRSMSLGDDADEGESESKRRLMVLFIHLSGMLLVWPA
ncbi:hypothetical protein MKW92_022779 [Papaver armeniacum]|nr:hypothetical protein MKW92_022779 [Papaver armeniacum]